MTLPLTNEIASTNVQVPKLEPAPIVNQSVMTPSRISSTATPTSTTPGLMPQAPTLPSTKVSFYIKV